MDFNTKYSKVEQIAFDIAEPIAKAAGCFVYDVQYVKEGGICFLRVYADKEGGISLPDCEGISRDVSAELDKQDPIKDNYYLEVSSPGVERKLKRPEHFEMNMGKDIDLGFYKAIDGQKVLTGKLAGYNDKVIKVETGEIVKEIQVELIAYVKLHFDM